MQWEWEVLAAVIRFLFFLAPFLNVEKEFGFAGNELVEAREFAWAGSCRAMLVSFPAELIIIVLGEASKKQCNNVNFLMVAVYIIAAVILAYGLFLIPATYFRGRFRPFVWLAIFTALIVVVKTVGVTPALSVICRP
jgi:hypothetical protein